MESDRQAQKQDSVFVDGKEFTVDVEYLSSISPYILNTLFGPMKNKDNEINGVDVKDFKLFLAIVNNEKCLKNVNIERALETCDFLMCDVALEICKKWIIERRQLDPRVKFAIGVRYRWNEVKNSVLETLKTILDIEKILPDSLETWDKPTTLMVLKWILSLFGIPRNLGVRSVGDVNEEQEKLKIQFHALTKKEEEISLLVTINRRRKSPTDDIFSIFHLDKLWKEGQDGWSETYSRDVLEKTLQLFGIPWSPEVTQESGLKNLKVQIHVLQKRMHHNREFFANYSTTNLDNLSLGEFNVLLREMLQRLED